MATPIIGIRDSGVGGLTVARRIRELLPHAALLYFADTAHVPYGDRAPDEVRHLALSISEFLIVQGAQLVVFACNTSSAYALDEARARFSVPVIGMIEPGARAALEAAKVSQGGPIGVLATAATVQSRVYTRRLQQLQPGTKCIEVACPEFVPLVESEQIMIEAAHDACTEYLQPLLDAGANTIILGCTHYPLLLPMLSEVAPHVRFVDPAEAVAKEVAARVQPPSPGPIPRAAGEGEGVIGSTAASAPLSRSVGEGPGERAVNDIFFVSGESEGVRHWISKLLRIEQPQVQRGPIFLPND